MNLEAARIEHLKLIQAVVDRLARSSFAVKSIAAASSGALVAFTASTNSPVSALAGFAILSLWLLDAFFLERERGFRLLYDSVRQNPPSEHEHPSYFAMEVRPATAAPGGLIGAAVSPSLSLFYPPLLLLVAASALIALR